MSLNKLTVHELLALMTRGEVTCEHILWDVLGRIEESEDKIKSFISMFWEWAL